MKMAITQVLITLLDIPFHLHDPYDIRNQDMFTILYLAKGPDGMG